MRFQKGEFCKNWDCQYVNFWIKCGFLPQRETQIVTDKLSLLQSALGECFSELAHKSPELQEEFLYNAETQRTLTKNGQTLISALNFFVSSVNTLCNKTMEDTIATVKQYETAR